MLSKMACKAACCTRMQACTCHSFERDDGIPPHVARAAVRSGVAGLMAAFLLRAASCTRGHSEKHSLPDTWQPNLAGTVHDVRAVRRLPGYRACSPPCACAPSPNRTHSLIDVSPCPALSLDLRPMGCP